MSGQIPLFLINLTNSNSSPFSPSGGMKDNNGKNNLTVGSTIFIKLYGFFNGKYYFDVLYNHFLVNKGLKLGYKISKEIDRGAIELIGPYGLSNNLYNTGINIAKLDTGIITTYSLYITIGLLTLLFLVFTPMLMDTSMFIEMRLFIIYLASTFFVLYTYLPKKGVGAAK